MLSTGKRFENNIRESIKDEFYYRFRDGTSSWSDGRTRFQIENIADCEIFDGERLYILELKSTKEHSLPFKNIRDHQIKDLEDASKHKNVICGLLINYDSLNECYFIEISVFKEFLKTTNRVSLPIEFCRENGLKIEVKLLRTNKRYDLRRLYGFRTSGKWTKLC